MCVSKVVINTGSYIDHVHIYVPPETGLPTSCTPGNRAPDVMYPWKPGSRRHVLPETGLPTSCTPGNRAPDVMYLRKPGSRRHSGSHSDVARVDGSKDAKAHDCPFFGFWYKLLINDRTALMDASMLVHIHMRKIVYLNACMLIISAQILGKKKHVSASVQF